MELAIELIFFCCLACCFVSLELLERVKGFFNALPTRLIPDFTLLAALLTTDLLPVLLRLLLLLMLLLLRKLLELLELLILRELLTEETVEGVDLRVVAILGTMGAIFIAPAAKTLSQGTDKSRVKNTPSAVANDLTLITAFQTITPKSNKLNLYYY